MRRRTRGGRNYEKLRRTTKRRENAMKIASLSSNKANIALKSYYTRLKEIESHSAPFNIHNIVKSVIQINKNPKIRTKIDYLKLVEGNLKKLEDIATKLVYTQSNTDLLELYKRSNLLSSHARNALQIAAQIHLSNIKNIISNEEANRKMDTIQSDVLRNTQPNISNDHSPVKLSIGPKHLELLSNVSNELERITYNLLINIPNKQFLSIHDKKMVDPAMIHDFTDTIESSNAYSNLIRNQLEITHVSKGGNKITSLYQWILDATDLSWKTTTEVAKRNYRFLSDKQQSTQLIECTMFQIRCQHLIYHIYLFLPVLKKFNVPGIPASNNEKIKEMMEQLSLWKSREEEFFTSPKDPSTEISMYQKKLERLEIVLWLVEYNLSLLNRKIMSSFNTQLKETYTAEKAKIELEIKETQEWLRIHDPNRKQGHVGQLIGVHEDAIIQASARPRSASRPGSAVASRLKTVPATSAEAMLAAYKKRELADRMAAQASKGSS